MMGFVLRLCLSSSAIGTRYGALRPPPLRSEALRQAGFDLAYLRREDYGPERVLELFLAEAFDGWRGAKLAGEKLAGK